LFCLVVIGRTFTLPNEVVFFYFLSPVLYCLYSLLPQGLKLIFDLRKLSLYELSSEEFKLFEHPDTKKMIKPIMVIPEMLFKHFISHPP
ncbi:hypothetical protein FHR92_005040, partial [Fontibacillus solani]